MARDGEFDVNQHLNIRLVGGPRAGQSVVVDRSIPPPTVEMYRPIPPADQDGHAPDPEAQLAVDTYHLREWREPIPDGFITRFYYVSEGKAHGRQENQHEENIPEGDKRALDQSLSDAHAPTGGGAGVQHGPEQR